MTASKTVIAVITLALVALPASAQGDSFAEKPHIEILRAGSKTWEPAGTLSDYRADKSALYDGQALANFTSCAELEAHR
jgi:hypothetical protein